MPIPASGFSEWSKPTKEAWRFTLKDDPKLIAFAGVWDAWKNPANSQWLQSYAIITVSVNSVLAPIPDRMPAILHLKDYERWLDHEEIERPPEDLLFFRSHETCLSTTPIRKSATCGIKALTCSTIDDEAPALCSYTYLSTGMRFDEALVRRFGGGSRFQFPLPVSDRDQKSRTPP